MDRGKRMIKLIITDLDGTLLRTDKTVSSYTKEVLQKCKAAGIKTAYATGRGLTAELVAPPDLFEGKITLNGAIATINNKIIYHRIMPHKTLHQFLVACEDRNLKITLENAGEIYANYPDTYAIEMGENFHQVNFTTHRTDAESIYSFDLTDQDLTFVTQALPADFHQYYTTTGAGFLMQIMHKEASKSKAAAALAQHWGIHPSETAAFGDDVNDTDLITFAGTGIAMGNAHEKVKAAANQICETNDNDGMAKWIEANVL
jgi:Cof subfamily protein (haloacid dehalogenase superfamily)